MFIDSHCHLDFPAFDADRAAVMAAARAEGVRGFLVAGVEPAGFDGQRALARAEVGVKWSAGLHPMKAGGVTLDAALAALPGAFEGVAPACAVGEIGLDGRFPEHLEAQRAAFQAQLAFARDRDLPVVLHIVKAHAEVAQILRSDGLPKAGGVIHAFTGSPEVGAAYIGMGLHLSLGTALLHHDARRVHRSAIRLPIERLLFETDAPDQPPPSGPSRNEPRVLLQVAAAAAHLRGEPMAPMLHQAGRNAADLFGSFKGD